MTTISAPTAAEAAGSVDAGEQRPGRPEVPGVKLPVGIARATAALAVASAALTAVIALRGWFYYDDFWSLQVAHDLGWGWDFLGRPVFGHLTPGSNALVGLVAGPGGFSYGWAVATVVVMAAAIPVMAAATARSLGVSPWRSVAAGAMAMVGAPLATGSVWWSAALLQYPSMLAGMVVLYGYGVWRRGAQLGMAVAALGLMGGLLFTEGTLVFLIPPVVLSLLPSSGGIRTRLGEFWTRRMAWLVLCSPIAVALVLRASASGSLASGERPSVRDLIAFPLALVFKGFLPSLAGVVTGRFDLFGSVTATTALGVVIATGGVAAAVLFRRRALVPPLVAVALTVYARGLMVAWSRLEMLGWKDAVEGRYYADLVWLVPVLFLAAWPPPVVARHERAVAEPSRRLRGERVVRFAGLGLVIALGLFGQAGIARNAPARLSKQYRDNLRSSWADAPVDAAVIDALVPHTVLGPQFGEFTFLSRTAGRGVPSLKYTAAKRWLAPNETGSLVPVRLGPLTDLRVDAAFTVKGAPGVRRDGACWVAGPGGALVWIPLGRPVLPGPWVLDLHLAGRSDAATRFRAAGRAPDVYIRSSPEGRTASRWVMSSVPFEASQIGFELPANGRFCLASGSVSQWVPTS